MYSLLAQVTKTNSTFSISVPNLYDPPLSMGLHSCNKCLLTTYYGPDTVVGTGEKKMYKTNKIPCSQS